MVAYKDPDFDAKYKFLSKRLSGINDLDRVLKPQDWNDRRNGQFRPMIGFTRDMPSARLSDSGHRMVQHEINQQNYHRRSDGYQPAQTYREFNQYGQGSRYFTVLL